MRIATSLEFFSDWRKYEIKNDTFYHDSFGEPKLRVAKINFLENNRFELIYPKDRMRYIFSKMDVEISDDMIYNKFFKEFNERKEELNCDNEFEK